MSQPPQGPPPGQPGQPYPPQGQPQSPYGQPYGGQQAPLNYQGPPRGPGLPKGMAITSMVLGICAFFPTCCLGWLSLIIAPVLAVLAIIFGIVGVKAAGRGEGGGAGMAKAGLILGIVYMALWAVLVVLALLGIGVAAFSASSGM